VACPNTAPERRVTISATDNVRNTIFFLVII
jgi:hypothetical protein